MGPPGLLLPCLMLWSCARLARGEESAGQVCGGLDGCRNISTLEVRRGDSQSLVLSLNADWQKLVKKCDPETKTWKEEILTGLGKANSLTNKATLIALVGGNFTVRNAEKAQGGLYKIERYLNYRCLAVVNVTVLDPPLPLADTPSFDVSSTVTSKVTEPPEASPPGTDYIAVYIAIAVAVAVPVIATVFLIKQLIKKKSKCRPNEASSEVDPEQHMNGSLPPQQEESTPV